MVRGASKDVLYYEKGKDQMKNSDFFFKSTPKWFCTKKYKMLETTYIVIRSTLYHKKNAIEAVTIYKVLKKPNLNCFV